MVVVLFWKIIVEEDISFSMGYLGGFMTCMNFLDHFHDCYSRYTGAPSQSQSEVRVACGALGDRRAPLFCVNSDAWAMIFQGGLVGGGVGAGWVVTICRRWPSSIRIGFHFDSYVRGWSLLISQEVKGIWGKGERWQMRNATKLPWGCFVFSRGTNGTIWWYVRRNLSNFPG